MDIKRSWNVPLTIWFDSGSSGNLKIIPILAGLMIALTYLFHVNSNKTNNIQSDHQHIRHQTKKLLRLYNLLLKIHHFFLDCVVEYIFVQELICSHPMIWALKISLQFIIMVRFFQISTHLAFPSQFQLSEYIRHFPFFLQPWCILFVWEVTWLHYHCWFHCCSTNLTTKCQSFILSMLAHCLLCFNWVIHFTMYFL